MNNILLLDPSIGSLNKGDEIIMECVESELSSLLDGGFVMRLPTQLPPLLGYQVARNTQRVKIYKNCNFKFVGGSNLLVKNLRCTQPQWNINLANYSLLEGAVLVGVGAGAGEKSNRYTEYIYRKMLHPDYFHSVRDERSRNYVESLGLKAINTGCVTMWALSPEFCRQIPTKKSDRVIFTVTAQPRLRESSKEILNILRRNYMEIWFWPQGFGDDAFLRQLGDVSDIHFLEATKDAYRRFLEANDTDYVGTRLHGGVYAMRHLRRSIILSIDERARSIHEKNHLNCIEIDRLYDLEEMINDDLITDVKMDLTAINQWKSQFGIDGKN